MLPGVWVINLMTRIRPQYFDFLSIINFEDKVNKH